MSEQLALYEGLVSDAQQSVKEAEENQRGDLPPLRWPSNGITHLRFYLDEYEVGGVKRLRIARKYWRHAVKLPRDDGKGYFTMRTLCEGDDCRQCKEAQRLWDVDYGKAWQYSHSLEGLCTVCVYKDPEAQADTVLNAPTFFVLDNRIVTSMDRFLAELDPKDASELLNPNEEQLGITLSWVKGSNGMQASFGFDHKKYALAELIGPNGTAWPSLDKSWIPEGKHIDDENFKKLQTEVSRIVHEKMNLEDPDGKSDGDLMAGTGKVEDPDVPAPEPTPEELVAEANKAPAEEPPAAVPDTAPTSDEKCAGILEGEEGYSETGMHFGAHPTTPQPTCILCDHQGECQKATPAAS